MAEFSVRSHVIFHPKERRLWVLDLTNNTLLAVEGDTVSEIKQGAELFSLAIDFASAHSVGLYYDTVRERPVFWAIRFSPGSSLDLFEFDGEKLVPLAQKTTEPTTDTDAIAFDPVRGVLVHFFGPEHSEEGSQQRSPAVHEMDATGAWKDVRVKEKPLNDGALFAGWDEARSRLIVFDDSRSVAYDGRSFTDVGEIPGLPWRPYAMALTPDTRRLVYLQRNRDTTPGTTLTVLEETGWKRRKTDGLVGFGGGAFDPVHGRTVFWGPSHGADHHERLFVALKPDRLEPGGPVCWELDAGTSTAGPPVFSGITDALQARSVEEDRAVAVPRLATVRGDQLVALPGLPASLLSLASYPEGTYAMSWRCEIFQLVQPADGAWKRIATAPPALRERRDANVAWHPTRVEATVVGGRLVEDRLGPLLTETWRFRDGAWKKLEVTGKPAVRAESSYPGSGAGIDAVSEEMVFLGGKLGNYKDNEKTWVCDGKKWKSFPTTFEGEEPFGSFLMGWDPGSRQLLLFANVRRSKGWSVAAYAHRGEGRWEFLVWLEPERAHAIAFSGRERVLHQFIRTGASNPAAYRIARAAIALPAAAPPEAAPAKAAKGKAKPKAKEPQEPVAPAVWLRYQDDESDKFWFASLEGKAFRARWGRRGAKEQSKTQSFASAELARKAYEKTVRAKLREGYEHAPEGESAALVPGVSAWHFSKPVKGGEDAFRGPAPLLADGEWPKCGCGERMTHVLTFHRHPERLPLTKHAAVGLFMCFKACGIDVEGRSKGVVPLPEEALPKRGKADLGFTYKKVFEPDTEIEDNAPEPEDVCKVGGRPAWLEEEEPAPECSVCHARMRFIAQLDWLDDEVDFAGGMVYLFLCPDEHDGRWLWQP